MYYTLLQVLAYYKPFLPSPILPVITVDIFLVYNNAEWHLIANYILSELQMHSNCLVTFQLCYIPRNLFRSLFLYQKHAKHEFSYSLAITYLHTFLISEAPCHLIPIQVFNWSSCESNPEWIIWHNLVAFSWTDSPGIISLERLTICY